MSKVASIAMCRTCVFEAKDGKCGKREEPGSCSGEIDYKKMWEYYKSRLYSMVQGNQPQAQMALHLLKRLENDMDPQRVKKQLKSAKREAANRRAQELEAEKQKEREDAKRQRDEQRLYDKRPRM